MVLISPSWWVDRPATDVWAPIMEWQAFLSPAQVLWLALYQSQAHPFLPPMFRKFFLPIAFSGLVTIFGLLLITPLSSSPPKSCFSTPFPLSCSSVLFSCPSRGRLHFFSGSRFSAQAYYTVQYTFALSAH